MRGACLIVSVSVANLGQEALGLRLGCLYYIDSFVCVCMCVCVCVMCIIYDYISVFIHMCVCVTVCDCVMVSTNDYLAASFNCNQVEL